MDEALEAIYAIDSERDISRSEWESPKADDEEIFYCKASGAEGRGLYTEEGFVILSGSVGRRANSSSLFASTVAFRNKLIETGVMQEVGETVVFQRDHLFRTPSAAGIALLGRTNNGWIEWRDEKGRTLNELKRQLSD